MRKSTLSNELQQNYYNFCYRKTNVITGEVLGDQCYFRSREVFYKFLDRWNDSNGDKFTYYETDTDRKYNDQAKVKNLPYGKAGYVDAYYIVHNI